MQKWLKNKYPLILKYEYRIHTKWRCPWMQFVDVVTDLVHAKIATQSWIHLDHQNQQYPASNAVDGKLGTCSYTWKDSTSDFWWQVNLGAMYTVTGVVIINTDQPGTYDWRIIYFIIIIMIICMISIWLSRIRCWHSIWVPPCCAVGSFISRRVGVGGTCRRIGVADKAGSHSPAPTSRQSRYRQ